MVRRSLFSLMALAKYSNAQDAEPNQPLTCPDRPDYVDSSVTLTCRNGVQDGTKCKFRCPEGKILNSQLTHSAKCSCIYIFGEAIDCAWSTNPDPLFPTISCLSPPDYDQVYRNIEASPEAEPEVYSTNDVYFAEGNQQQVGISVSSDDNAYADDVEYSEGSGSDPITSDFAAHDVEYQMHLQDRPNVCKMPFSPSGREILTCTDSRSENSTCTVTCPTGYLLAEPDNTSMTCSCDSGDDLLLSLGCQWDNTPSECVRDPSVADSEVEVNDNFCISLAPPEDGTMECNLGFDEGTTCKFSCDAEPYEFLYPLKSGRRKCKCSEKKGCYWTKPKLHTGTCQPAPIDFEQICSEVPETPNSFTSINCDDDNNHGSKCQIECANNFKLKQFVTNKTGAKSRCHCRRKAGEYSCDWTKPMENKLCVPTAKWFTKNERSYIEAQDSGDMEEMTRLSAEFQEADQIRETYLVAKKKRRRRSHRA